jgi:hypothetical protein
VAILEIGNPFYASSRGFSSRFTYPFEKASIVSVQKCVATDLRKWRDRWDRSDRIRALDVTVALPIAQLIAFREIAIGQRDERQTGEYDGKDLSHQGRGFLKRCVSLR